MEPTTKRLIMYSVKGLKQTCDMYNYIEERRYRMNNLRKKQIEEKVNQWIDAWIEREVAIWMDR